MATSIFSRITKTASALAANHFLHLLMQLILPPLFLAKYGIKNYSEWLVLSAAIGFFSVLDLGLQTYVANKLTVFYHNNDLDNFHRFQTTGLLISLIAISVAAALALAVFLLPVGRWLSVSMPSARVAAILYLLVLHVLVLIIWGQLASVYRAIGRAYRSVMWFNLQKISMLAVTIAAVASKQSFVIVASLQLVVALLSLASVWLDLKLKFKDVSVKPIRVEWSLAKEILKPSLYFSLFFFNNFLIYQFPVLILNRFETPLAIIVFSVGRTLFSFVRQGLSVIQASIAPEITRLEGIKDWFNLKKLYQYTESLTISATVTINAGIFLTSPFLLQVWMKRDDLFGFWPMLFLMLIAAVMCLKDFKFYYQSMTNRHEKMAMVMFFTYIAMALLSFWAIKWFGLNGFLSVWLAVEALQLVLLHGFNRQLFKNFFIVSSKPGITMSLVLLTLATAAIAFQSRLINQTAVTLVTQGIFVSVILFLLAYFFLGLRDFFRLFPRGRTC